MRTKLGTLKIIFQRGLGSEMILAWVRTKLGYLQ